MSTDASWAGPEAPARPDPVEPAAVRSLVGLPVLRVALVGFAGLLTWLALAAAGDPGPFPPTSLFAAAAMLPVNLVTLALERRALHLSLIHI